MPTSYLPRRLTFALLLLAPASAQIVTNLGSIDWHNPAGWSTGRIPGGTETPQISNGTVTVTGAYAVHSINLFGGVLAGSGTLTIIDSGSQWKGGVMTGTGTLQIATGANLELAGAGPLSLYRGDGYGTDGHKLENLGTVSWTGAGNLLGGDGAQIINQPGGLFDLKSDATLGYTGGGNTPSFTNAGTFRKSAGTGTSSVAQTAFTNNGSVEVLTGTLSFAAGVTSNGGTFAAAAGTSLLFGGGQNFNTGTTFLGPGLIRIDGGTTTIAGAISSTSLNFAAGTLQGTGTLTGALGWTGGVWSGTGTLTIASGGLLEITGAANKFYNRGDGYGSDGRVIENFGTTIWIGAGQLLGGDGGQIINRSSGVFLVQNDSVLGYTGGGNGPTITNQGLFRKNTATGTTSVSGGGFVNAGLVEAQTGTIAFSSGVTSNAGSFAATADSTITFLGGQTFNNGTSFSSPAGKIRIVSGATTISGNLTAAGLEFAGGDLYGAGTIGGSMAWTAGVWRADNVVTFAPASELTLSGAADKTLVRGDGYGTGGRVVRAGGTLAWYDAGRIVGNDGAGIEVLASGIFEIRNDSSFVYGGGGNIPFLANAGMVRKFASAGTTQFDGVAFTNTGTLQVLGGNLTLTGGGGLANHGLVEVQSGTLVSSASGLTSTGGTFNVSSGAQLRFTGGTNTLNSSAFTGPGFAEVAGGTLVANGSTIDGNFQLASGTIGGSGMFTVNSGGTFTWSGGNLVDVGTLAVAAGGALQIGGSNPKYFYRGDGYGTGGRAIANSGVTTWVGTGSVLGGDGAVFNNFATGVFDAQSDATFGYSGGGNMPVFSNAGLLRKSGGAGVTNLALPLYNSGIVESQSGTVRLGGGGSGSGQFVASGGVIDFATSYTLDDGARFLGSTPSRLTAGTLTVPGTATVGGTGIGRFAFEGGTLGGAGVFAVGQFGEAVWSGGNLIGTGTLRVAAGGALLVSGAGDHDFYRGDGYGTGGRTIENFGTITWSGGQMRGGDGAQFNNAAGGLFDITGTSTFGYTGGGNLPAFTNAGTLRKSAGVGVSTIAIPFSNTGQIAVTNGTLAFTSTFSSTNGGVTLANGATLSTTSPLHVGTAPLAGAGTIAAPSVVAGGLVSPGASPGQLNIAGDLNLLATATSRFELGGTLQGVSYDFLNVSGAAQLDGTLQLAFVNGFQFEVAPTDAFTLLSASARTSTFLNAPTSGLRIFTSDGFGSFQVDYTPSALVVSNFVAVPEPATWLLLALGALALLGRSPRRGKRSE